MPGTHRKATFFCPDCGRSDAVDGDWVVRDALRAGDRHLLAYECPQCGAVLPEIVPLRRLPVAGR